MAHPGPQAHRHGGFLAQRWRGDVPLRTLLWRDMLGVGTVLNILATFVALMAASQGAPLGLAAALHFAPLPYNLFLFAAVTRARPRPAYATTLAGVWLVLMTLV